MRILFNFVAAVWSCLIAEALTPQAIAETIKFGAMAELTGPGAENGTACQTGYEIAVNLFTSAHPELSGRTQIVFGDHKREQRTAISEFQRFGELGVWAVAANHGLIGAVINPLSKKSRIPLFGVMGHDDFVRSNPYAVRIIPTPLEEGGALADQAYKDGVRNAALLLLEDDYILAVGKAFERTFKKLGGTIVYKEFFVESEADFASIATRIKAAKPDALAMTLGFQQFGPAIRRLREQGVNQPIYANYWLSYPSIIGTAGGPDKVEGSVYVTEKSDYPVFDIEWPKFSKPGQFRSGVVYRCYSALAAALFSFADCQSCKTRDDYASHVSRLSSVKLPDRILPIEKQEAKFEIERYRFVGGKAVMIK